MSKIKDITSFQLNDTDVLIIHMPNSNKYTNQHWIKQMDDTRKGLQDLFPNTSIIISAYEINLMVISRKRTFLEKLFRKSR